MRTEKKLEFKNARNMAAWIKTHTGVILSKEQMELLLGYMEGHDYQLAICNDETMVRIDLQDESDIEEYSIEDVILLASEWNDSLLEIAQKELGDREQDYDNDAESILLQHRYMDLKDDEEKLYEMYSQTEQAKLSNKIASKKMTA